MQSLEEAIKNNIYTKKQKHLLIKGKIDKIKFINTEKAGKSNQITEQSEYIKT